MKVIVLKLNKVHKALNVLIIMLIIKNVQQLHVNVEHSLMLVTNVLNNVQNHMLLKMVNALLHVLVVMLLKFLEYNIVEMLVQLVYNVMQKIIINKIPHANLLVTNTSMLIQQIVIYSNVFKNVQKVINSLLKIFKKERMNVDQVVIQVCMLLYKKMVLLNVMLHTVINMNKH